VDAVEVAQLAERACLAVDQQAHPLGSVAREVQALAGEFERPAVVAGVVLAEALGALHPRQ